MGHLSYKMKNPHEPSQPDALPTKVGFFGRLLKNPTLKSVREGLGVELMRDLIKGALMSLGGIVFAMFLGGFGELTWSLKSFRFFGAVNEVDTPNQKLRDNSVYRVPLGISVRLEDGEFLALSRDYRDRIIAVLTSSEGHREDQAVSPSNPLFEKFGCDQIGVQLMEVPEEDADSVLVLYTVERVSSDECSRFWN